MLTLFCVIIVTTFINDIAGMIVVALDNYMHWYWPVTVTAIVKYISMKISCIFWIHNLIRINEMVCSVNTCCNCLYLILTVYIWKQEILYTCISVCIYLRRYRYIYICLHLSPLYIRLYNFPFFSNSNSKSVYCHVNTFSTTVQKKYIQYKSSIRTQYDIIHNIHGKGSMKPLQACELHIWYTIFFHNIRGAMCILNNFVHKTTISGIYHISQLVLNYTIMYIHKGSDA